MDKGLSMSVKVFYLPLDAPSRLLIDLFFGARAYKSCARFHRGQLNDTVHNPCDTETAGSHKKENYA